MASADVLIIDCSGNLEDGRRVLQGLVRDGSSTQESSSESLSTFRWTLSNKYYSADLAVSTVCLSRLPKPWMSSVDVSKAEVFMFVVNLADMPSAGKVAEVGAYLSDIKAFYRELMFERPLSPEVVMCVGLSGNGDNDREESQLSMVENHFQSRDQDAGESSDEAPEGWFVEAVRICLDDQPRDLALWDDYGEGLTRVKGALDTVNWPNLKPNDNNKPAAALDQGQRSEDESKDEAASRDEDGQGASHLDADGDEPDELKMFEKMFQQVLSVREDSQNLGDEERRKRASDMVMRLAKEFMIDEDDGDDVDGTSER